MLINTDFIIKICIHFWNTLCREKKGRGSNRDKVEHEMHHLFISLAIQNTYEIIKNCTYYVTSLKEIK